MNARVFLLILVTGSFMAVWNSDQEAMQAALAKRQKQNEAELPAIADIDLQKTSAQLFSHDDAEWQAWIGAIHPIEVSGQDVLHAEDVAAIELEHGAVQTLNPVLTSIEDTLQHEDTLIGQVPREDRRTDENSGADVALRDPSVAEDPQNHNPVSDEGAPAVVNIEEHQSAEGESAVEVTVGTDSSDAHSPATPVASPAEGRTIPLPENLASGTWQIVHASGRSIRITIERATEKDAERQIPTERTDEELEEHFCIRTSATGERWCFIRSYETASPTRHVATEFFSPGQTMNERQ